jgi:PAS domain S-box-containing protein
MRHRLIYSVIFIILLCLISVFYQLSNNTHFDQINLEQELFNKTIQMDSDIDRELLLLHERVKNNYDAVTTMLKRKYVYLEEIDRLGLNFDVAALKQSFDEKTLLIEEFKSEDSILHNSETYFPILINRLKKDLDMMQPNNNFTDILLQLKTEVLLFVHHKSIGNTYNIDSYVKDIDSLIDFKDIQEHVLWDGVKRHVVSISTHTSKVNNILHKVLSSKYRLLLNAQYVFLIDKEKEIKGKADLYKFCLFLTTLSLFFYCVWFYFRINKYTNQLSHLNATLEDKVEERNHELNMSVSRRNELINSSPSIIYAMNAFGDFRTTYISGNVELKLGYAPAMMMDDNGFWLERVHPDDKAHVQKSFNELLKKSFVVTEYRLLDNVNNYHWIQDSARLIFDEKGDPLEIIGSWADISQLKQITNDLGAEKEYSENLLKNQSNPTFVIDENHIVLSWNRACEELTGLKSEDVVGTCNHWRGFYQEERQCLADTVIDISSEHASDLYIKSTLLEEGIHAENWCTVAKGEEKFLSIDAAPIYDKNKNLIAVVENLRDMTKQKNLEGELLTARDDALDAARFKSEFLANMSHEIRTPMNGVLGMLQLIKDFELPDECQDYICTAHNSADALLEIINDILDFSKIEAGKLNIEKVDFDLQEIVNDVCDLLSERVKGKDVELLSYVDNKVPARLKGDPTRLRQIMFNLLGNAIKFTEKGEVVIRLVNVLNDNNQSTIKIEVIDTGIGIPEKVMSALFEAFTQADGSTTRKFGGTGLGLTICKQLVEMMGGKLDVESEPGKGSNFFFTLSFDVVEQDKSNIEIKELEELNALIIDDNNTNRIIVCNYLNAWGMVVEEASDVDLAFQLLSDKVQQGKQFDLVLLDMQMPKMDGVEFSKKMQAHEKLAGIPRIMLTSAGQLPSDVWRPSGINACLQKPYRREQLRSTISSILNVKTEMLQKEKKTGAKVIPFKHNDSKILLVEDNLVNQKVACGLLKKIGLVADIAGNGQIALDKIAETHYDIVLMDCQMPVMSGYEATEAIRSNEENTNKHLTIIAMTANAMEGDKEKCFESGMDDYLPKPVKLNVLKEVLDKWIKLNKENQLSEEQDMGEQPINKSNGVIIDETVLSSLKEIMEDEFIEVLKLYMDESVSLMSDIHAGFSEEPDELLRAVHTLKSSSLNVGAMCLGDIAANMEALVKSGDIDAAKMYLDDLQDSFTETHSMMNQYAQSNVIAAASS